MLTNNDDDDGKNFQNRIDHKNYRKISKYSKRFEYNSILELWDVDIINGNTTIFNVDKKSF